MSQKNLPQITKHFQAFIYFHFSQNIFWQFDHPNIWTQLRLPLFSFFEKPVFHHFSQFQKSASKSAKNSYLGPLVGVSILLHFSLSLNFKNSICGLLKSFSWFFEVQSAAAAAAGQAPQESCSALWLRRAGGGGGTHRCPISLCTQ